MTVADVAFSSPTSVCFRVYSNVVPVKRLDFWCILILLLLFAPLLIRTRFCVRRLLTGSHTMGLLGLNVPPGPSSRFTPLNHDRALESRRWKRRVIYYGSKTNLAMLTTAFWNTSRRASDASTACSSTPVTDSLRYHGFRESIFMLHPVESPFSLIIACQTFVTYPCVQGLRNSLTHCDSDGSRHPHRDWLDATFTSISACRSAIDFRVHSSSTLSTFFLCLCHNHLVAQNRSSAIQATAYHTHHISYTECS